MQKHLIKSSFITQISILIFLSACVSLFCDGISKPAPLKIAEVKVDPDYDNLFSIQKHGFLGADGAASIQLAPGRILWIFGDTILGTLKNGKREGTMIHNTIAIQKISADKKNSISYHWDLKDNIPGDFFPPSSYDDPFWYWPGTGITIKGKAYIFLTKVDKSVKSPLEGLAFATKECVLFIVKNPGESPEKWEISQINLGYGDNHFNINSGCFLEGDYLYLLGYDDGKEDKPLERNSILCRIPAGKLDSPQIKEHIEFWSKGDKWLPSPDNLQPLFSPGSTESFITYIPSIKRYVSSTMKPFAPDYYIFSAERITGPWTDAQKIYDVPELEKNTLYHAYAGRGHMMLPCNSDEIVLSYVVNTSDFWSVFTALDIYYPRFIRVKFDTNNK